MSDELKITDNEARALWLHFTESLVAISGQSRKVTSLTVEACKTVPPHLRPDEVDEGWENLGVGLLALGELAEALARRSKDLGNTILLHNACINSALKQLMN